MLVREFIKALYSSWVSLLSGIASIVLAVWALGINPDLRAQRIGLVLASLICLLVAVFRAWREQYIRAEGFRFLLESKALQLFDEFERLRVKFVDNDMEHLIAVHLGQFRTFFTDHPKLLENPKVIAFYQRWIRPNTVALSLGAPVSMSWSGSEYAELTQAVKDLRLSSNEFADVR